MRGKFRTCRNRNLSFEVCDLQAWVGDPVKRHSLVGKSETCRAPNGKAGKATKDWSSVREYAR